LGNIVFYLLIGLGVGALYAMLGMGVVIGYQGSGVVNFAQGAVAMYVVFNFTQLRGYGSPGGSVYLPWVNFLPGRHTPVKLQLTHGPMPFVPAVAVALLMAVLVGALVHFLVFRPLRHASALAKVVASVGLLLYLQAVALLNFGQLGRQLNPTLPGGAWRNFLGLHHSFPRENLYAAVAAAVVAGALWLLFRYTRLGLATRAAAETEKGAVLLGYSPDLLAGTSWILSSVVGGAAGLLVGPIAGQVTPVQYDGFIVPALAAALVGLFASFPLTLLGGLFLGVLGSLAGYWSAQPWFPAWLGQGQALSSVIALLLIAVILFVRGDSLPSRGAVGERRLPPASRPVRIPVWVIVGGAAVLLYGAFEHGPWDLALTTTMITAVLMLSYVVVTGYVGQISMAQLGLSGVAGFFMVKLMSSGNARLTPFPIKGPGLPMIVAMPLAILLAVVVGIVVGLPAVRIRGVQLAIITLAGGLTMENLYFNNPKLTGVQQGSGALVPRPDLLGLNLSVVGKGGLSDRYSFTVFVVVILVAVSLLVTNLRRSASGRRFLAVRANERAAAATGIDVTRTKLLAFAFSAAIAGLSGCLLAFQQQNISSANFDALAGLATLAFAYLGGISSVNGALVGGFIGASGVWSYFLQSHFTNLVNYWVLFGGIGLIVTAIANPMGIAPAVQILVRMAATAVSSWRTPEWLRAARRLGPPVAVGAAAGWLLWGRFRRFSLWEPFDGALLALIVRATALQVWAGVRARQARRRGTPSPMVAHAEPTVPAAP